MVLDEKTVIDISDLSIQLYSSHLNRWFKAVEGINLSVKNNSKLAIVGESGCGKSITAMSILKLINTNTAKLSGIVKFNGENLIDLDNNLLGKISLKRFGTIDQFIHKLGNQTYTRKTLGIDSSSIVDYLRKL